jgi:hypothetical protein
METIKAEAKNQHDLTTWGVVLQRNTDELGNLTDWNATIDLTGKDGKRYVIETDHCKVTVFA